jgi:hypothetical protein
MNGINGDGSRIGAECAFALRFALAWTYLPEWAFICLHPKNTQYCKIFRIGSSLIVREYVTATTRREGQRFKIDWMAKRNALLKTMLRESGRPVASSLPSPLLHESDES